MKNYFVYIMTNRKRGVLSTGVTNDLVRRVYEHKNILVKGFSSRYNLTNLIYFEDTPDVITAIGREKRIKGWMRNKKIKLIESVNPEWKDISEEW